MEGIPNFFITQCISLLEENKTKIVKDELKEVAIALLTDIWITMPELFSKSDLQNKNTYQNADVEADDFGLKERLNKIMVL